MEVRAPYGVVLDVDDPTPFESVGWTRPDPDAGPEPAGGPAADDAPAKPGRAR